LHNVGLDEMDPDGLSTQLLKRLTVDAADRLCAVPERQQPSVFVIGATHLLQDFDDRTGRVPPLRVDSVSASAIG